MISLGQRRIAALLAIAITLGHFLPANTDVGWLLTVAGRVLDGQQFETASTKRSCAI
jgi:hypothetical protein